MSHIPQAWLRTCQVSISYPVASCALHHLLVVGVNASHTPHLSPVVNGVHVSDVLPTEMVPRQQFRYAVRQGVLVVSGEIFYSGRVVLSRTCTNVEMIEISSKKVYTPKNHLYRRRARVLFFFRWNSLYLSRQGVG